MNTDLREEFQRLADADYITFASSDEEGSVYEILDEQEARLFAVLRHPDLWPRSPRLSLCMNALKSLRETIISINENGLHYNEAASAFYGLTDDGKRLRVGRRLMAAVCAEVGVDINELIALSRLTYPGVLTEHQEELLETESWVPHVGEDDDVSYVEE